MAICKYSKQGAGLFSSAHKECGRNIQPYMVTTVEKRRERTWEMLKKCRYWFRFEEKK